MISSSNKKVFLCIAVSVILVVGLMGFASAAGSDGGFWGWLKHLFTGKPSVTGHASVGGGGGGILWDCGYYGGGAVCTQATGCEGTTSPRDMRPCFMNNPPSDQNYCAWSPEENGDIHGTYDGCYYGRWDFAGPEPYQCYGCDRDGTHCSSAGDCTGGNCDCTQYLSGFPGQGIPVNPPLDLYDYSSCTASGIGYSAQEIDWGGSGGGVSYCMPYSLYPYICTTDGTHAYKLDTRFCYGARKVRFCAGGPEWGSMWYDIDCAGPVYCDATEPDAIMYSPSMGYLDGNDGSLPNSGYALETCAPADSNWVDQYATTFCDGYIGDWSSHGTVTPEGTRETCISCEPYMANVPENPNSWDVGPFCKTACYSDSDCWPAYYCDGSNACVARPVCGDGSVEGNEVCEPGQTQSCTTDSGYAGTQSCLSDCSGYDNCVSSEYCGDSIINDGEVCDGGSQSCTTWDGYSGYQNCLASCSGWDTCGTSESCGDGTVNGNEQCDEAYNNGAPDRCCSSTCTLLSSGSVCRASGGECDLEETCDGSSPICPPDYKSTAECRADAGECDMAEFCDGSNNECPPDSFEPYSTWCTTTFPNEANQCDGNGNCVCSYVSEESCSDNTGFDGLDNNCDGTPDLNCNNICDADGDGYYSDSLEWYQKAYCLATGYNSGDCDDSNSGVYAGAAEVCDGLDNNCDGSTDEGLGSTTCGEGVCWHTVDNCVGGVTQECNAFEGATEEICNGLDDDCDGSVDEGLGSTTCGWGICEHTVDNCVGGVAQECDPMQGATAETCNNLDDDCDLQVDEELVIETTCGVGICEGNTGSRVCTAGVWSEDSCNPFLNAIPESCEAAPYSDEDCDGTINNGCACEQLQTQSCGPSTDEGECAFGMQVCDIDGIWSECYNAVYPATETCDGLDNDCDGAIDEDFPDKGDSCEEGLGECFAVGFRMCSVDGLSTVCSVEAGQPTGNDDDCNGLDENCNGIPDDNYVPVDTTCGIGECAATGQLVCFGGATSDTCVVGSPVDESCDSETGHDGLDNNCDGTADLNCDSYCDADGDGYTSHWVCVLTGFAPGDCDDTNAAVYSGAPEVCDGLDNNCDENIDEGLTFDNDNDGYTSGDSCSGSKNDCNDNDASINPGAMEVCDGIDNNCDGSVDEGGVCQVCGNGMIEGSEVCDGTNLGGGGAVPQGVVVAGGYHACGVLPDGTAKCWGNGGNGRLGDGVTQGNNFKPTPVSVVGLTSAVQISAGYAHTCAVLLDGTISCWGYNGNGQIGDGTQYVDRLSPVSVVGITNAVQVGLRENSEHSCAVLSDGTVKCWGRNTVGQIGDGTTVDKLTPVSVSGITNAVQVAAGPVSSCAVLSDGTIKCWGANYNGGLGDGTTTGRLTPVSVSGITNAVQVDTSVYHTCAVLSDGTVKCWGGNYYGSIGDGTNVDRWTPVSVPGITTAVQVSTGWYHTCVALADGTVKCWGANGYGEVGNGMTGFAVVSPASVLNLADAVQVTTGREFSCALLSDGTLSCWGRNMQGQHGDGTFVDKTSPSTLVLGYLYSSSPTCKSLGFAGGTLACGSTCSAFDTSGCLDQICGDGIVQGTEECDGSAPASCTVGGVLGTHTCNNAVCMWNECMTSPVNGDKKAALATLRALPGTNVDPLKKAIELLNKSLTERYWIDSTHVLCKTSPGGDSLVFDKERDSVYHLMKITPTDKFGRYATVRQVILDIVAVDRLLATTLINEAPAGREKTNALKEIVNGDKYAAQGKYKDAIEHYKKAWQQVEKVAPLCVGMHTIITE